MGREGSIVLVLAVAALSCAQAPPPGTPEVQPVSAAPPAFELRTVERSEGDCAAEAAPCAHFVARFPVVTGGLRAPVREVVNGSIASLVARAGGAVTAAEESEERVPGTVEEAAVEFLSGWSQSRAELPEDAPAGYARWVDERRMEVIHADHRVLSVELDLYAFTGGAHPNTFIELQSYDLATGEPLELADLVAAGAGPRLDELGERLFRRAREIPEGESLAEAGFWFEDDRFQLTDNFAVIGEGLVFVFNPYEVAPYVFGPTRITLPWSELRGLLRPEAPAAPAAAPARKAATHA
jgi:hypothetical protein